MPRAGEWRWVLHGAVPPLGTQGAELASRAQAGWRLCSWPGRPPLGGGTADGVGRPPGAFRALGEMGSSGAHACVVGVLQLQAAPAPTRSRNVGHGTVGCGLLSHNGRLMRKITVEQGVGHPARTPCAVASRTHCSGWGGGRVGAGPFLSSKEESLTQVPCAPHPAPCKRLAPDKGEFLGILYETFVPSARQSQKSSGFSLPPCSKRLRVP